MALVLTEEQQLLRDSARSFFRDKSPVSALRALRDRDDPLGFNPALWREMAAMGWPGAFLPQHHGGIGCGFTELGVVMEAAGRALTASPLFATVALGASALLLGGSEEQKSHLLPRIAQGELLLALALQEGARHDPRRIATRASSDDNGFILHGSKQYVADGHVAHTFIVVARSAAGESDSSDVSLFLVDADTDGVCVERNVMVDSRNMASVRFDGVRVNRQCMLGEPGQGEALLQQVVDRGNIALCAEMLGSLQEAFQRTLDYLKLRRQFGVAIGSFQALQHRAAQMFCEIELCRSVVMKALASVDANTPELSLVASLAKVQVSETFRLVSDEAIQMHGGIGMTDEEEIGFFLKRARVAQQMPGDEYYHLARYARLRGY